MLVDVRSTRNTKYLSGEELDRLFSVIHDARDRAIFRIGYHRGLRAGEVRLLQLSDYQPTTGRLYVHRLKNGHSGEYLLTQMEVKALKAWLKVRGGDAGALFPSNRGTAISQQMLDVLMKRYCAAATIPSDKAHFHTLRHSCATSLIEHDQDIAYVKDHLGHCNIASTDIYAKITNKRRDQIGKSLRGWR